MRCAAACVLLIGLLTVSGHADAPQITAKRTDVKPFEYVEANVPFYPPSQQWGRTGEPIKRMQKPLDPAESMKHFVTPVGFSVHLFASEPDFGGKPIAMAWDERGRLWVAVTVDYPNDKQPEGQGHDKIVICEDTKGTGRADKFTVFADRLSLPTSLIFAHGGIIVHQPPETLFLKDTNGDDVADVRQVLFTGWSTRDTHAGPSNLRYGLDNWIYGIVGYSGYRGTIGGERLNFSQGFYRFKPDGSKMEFLRNTNNNSWGVGFSEEGLLFGSTANGNPSVHLPIPNRYYESVRGWSSSVLPGIAGNAPMYPITDKVRQVDWHGHFTAGAGHALYTARTYPQIYWNRTAFVNEPTGHLLATFEILPNGGTFRSHNAWNLLASDDEWSAPIVAEVGPDGQVWAIDWYNFIVQHNPTPPGWKTGKGAAYETELRDKKHGRIYRIVYDAGKPSEVLNLHGATPDQLVAALHSPNMLWRTHAQRLLVERGKLDVLPALVRTASETNVDAIGLNPAAIHALWTLHGLGALDGTHPEATAVAVQTLGHPSPGVRRNAVQVLPHSADSVGAILKSGLLKDTDPQVRLAALLALADQPPSPAAAKAVLAALTEGQILSDRWLTDAATSAAAAHDSAFLAAALDRKEPVPPGLIVVLERVAEHHARGGSGDGIAALLTKMTTAPAPVTAAVLTGLTKGWPKDRPPKLDAAAEKTLVELFPKLPSRGQGQLVELASRWQSRVLDGFAQQIAGQFLAQVRDEKAADKDRSAAAAQLIDLRKSDAGTAKQMLELITPRTSPELAHGLLDALTRSEAPSVGTALVEALPTQTPGVRSAALRALLGRADWTAALLGALEQGKVPLTELSLDQRQGLASHPRRDIAGRARRLLARGGGLPSPDRQKVVEELTSLTQRHGDAAAGKLVFKNQCAKCHTHSGEGAKIGPDLTGMAVHPKEHLLTEILDPSRSVEGNYRQYVLTTRNGRVLNGLLVSETKTAVELLDAEDKRHTVLREDIEELQTTNKSLMPDGFEKQLSPNDLVNLLEFLTHRDKYLPLPLAKAATGTSARGLFNDEERTSERLMLNDWSPRTVEGVPFTLIDPQGGRLPNLVLLYSPNGSVPPKMPRSVTLPCNAPARAIHLLGGISGWGFPDGDKGSVSLIVRLHYADGKTEDHPLHNGVELADYSRRVEVPGSKFAFEAQGKQVRYLAIQPKRTEPIKEIEFVKGPDATAPVILAVTVEAPR